MPSIIWILALVFMTGTSVAASDDVPAPSPWVTGIVQHLDMEGGFFGITTDDGKKLFPMHLPKTFQKNGLPIRFRYKELKNVMSIQMWGTSVAVTDIEERIILEKSPDS